MPSRQAEVRPGVSGALSAEEAEEVSLITCQGLCQLTRRASGQREGVSPQSHPSPPTRLHRAALLLAVLSPGLGFKIPAF